MDLDPKSGIIYPDTEPDKNFSVENNEIFTKLEQTIHAIKCQIHLVRQSL